MGFLPEHRWTPCLRDGLIMYWVWQPVSMAGRSATTFLELRLISRSDLGNGSLSDEPGVFLSECRPKWSGPLRAHEGIRGHITAARHRMTALRDHQRFISHEKHIRVLKDAVHFLEILQLYPRW